MSAFANLMGRIGFEVKDGKLVSVNQKLTETERRMRSAAREARNAQRAISGTFNAMALAAKGYVAYRVGRFFTTDWAQSADAMMKISGAIGITTDSYQGLTYAASLSGLAQNDLNTGLTKLGKKAYDAAHGNVQLAQTFKKLGIAVTDSDKKVRPADELFLDLADKFSAMKAGGDKTALSMILFEESGAKFINMLNNGRGGIKAFTEEAKKLGYVMSEKQAKQAEKLNDSMFRLKAISMGLRNMIALELVPRITDMATRFKDWYITGNNAVRLMGWLQKAAIFASAAMALIVTNKMLTMFKAFGSYVAHMTRALVFLGRAGLMANIKVGLLVATIALIGLAIEDLIGFAQGKDSLIGRVLGDSKEGKELKTTLLVIGDSLKSVGSAFTKYLAPVLPWLAKWLGRILVAAVVLVASFIVGLQKIGEWVAWLGGALVSMWESAVDAWHSFTQAIADGWAWIKNTFASLGGAISGAFATAYDVIKAMILKVIDVVTWPFRKVVAAYEWMKNKINPSVGGSKWGERAEGISLPADFMATRGQPANSNKSVSVGNVTVSVAGTTGMGKEELEAAVKAGTHQALHRLILDAFGDYREVAS